MNVICRAGPVGRFGHPSRLPGPGPGGKGLGLERYGTVKSGRVLSLAAQTGPGRSVPTGNLKEHRGRHRVTWSYRRDGPYSITGPGRHGRGVKLERNEKGRSVTEPRSHGELLFCGSSLEVGEAVGRRRPAATLRGLFVPSPRPSRRVGARQLEKDAAQSSMCTIYLARV